MKDIQLVRDLLGNMHPGEGKSVGAVTLIPFFAAAQAPDYFTAKEAMELGALRIEEHEGGTVRQIVALNDSDLPVLMLDGEHLEGAMQSRILNVTVMLPARSRTLLPVSCVEQGRWRYEAQRSFAPSPDHAYGRLRRVQAEATVAAARRGAPRQADQSRVWADVAAKHGEAGVLDSRSGAMRDAYDRDRSTIDRFRKSFGAPLPGQTGVLCLVGGTPSVADVFDKPATLAKVWPRFLSAFALDAVGAAAGEPAPGVVEEFVAVARGGDWMARPGLAAGTDVVMEAPLVVGSALAFEGGIPHLALFGRDARPKSGGAPRRGSRHFFHSS